MKPVLKDLKKMMSYTTGQELEEAQNTVKLLPKHLTLGEVLLSALEELQLLKLMF